MIRDILQKRTNSITFKEGPTNINIVQTTLVADDVGKEL